MPTTQLMEAWFGQFNEAYFGGVLPKPLLRVVNTKTSLGQFQRKSHRCGLRGLWRTTHVDTIKLSRYYDIDEHTLQSVMLHEMIHYYIAYTGIRDNAPHGRAFRKLMQSLNERHGWHVTVSTHMDLRPVPQNRAHVVLVMAFSDGRRYYSVVNPGYAKAIEASLADIEGLQWHDWYATNDARFDGCTKTRTLRARRAGEEEFARIMACLKATGRRMNPAEPGAAR